MRFEILGILAAAVSFQEADGGHFKRPPRTVSRTVSKIVWIGILLVFSLRGTLRTLLSISILKGTPVFTSPIPSTCLQKGAKCPQCPRSQLQIALRKQSGGVNLPICDRPIATLSAGVPS